MMAASPPPTDVLGYGPIREDLDAGRLGLVWGTATAFADSPAKVTATSDDMARSMSVSMNVMDLVMASKSEVMISSPYFIPGARGVAAFGDLAKRRVKVSILTNSLAANDEPLVHTGYSRYRVELLKMGVDLYELSPTRIQKAHRLGWGGMSIGRLHGLAFQAALAIKDKVQATLGAQSQGDVVARAEMAASLSGGELMEVLMRRGPHRPPRRERTSTQRQNQRVPDF